MPGRSFFTIIRPGHLPDKLPSRTKSHLCLRNPAQSTSLKTSGQLKQGGMSAKTFQRKSRFCVKVKKGGQAIADEPGLCGKCHLKFDRIRSHLRKCHPRLYRRVMRALRDAGPIKGVNPSSKGDVKEHSTNL